MSDNSANSAFRPQAPSLRVVSLRTEPNEANPNPDAPLPTMQSKELSLKEVKDKAKNQQQTRYDQMDADDKSTLKSAISRVVGSGKNAGMIPGETIDQFQKRIMVEVLDQLATKFEEVKESHA